MRDPHAGDLYMFRGLRGDHVTWRVPIIRFSADEEN